MTPTGLRARMIAEAACSWTRWVSVISTSSSPAATSEASNSRRVRAPAMQPVHCGHVGPGRLVHVLVGHHVGDGEAAARLQNPRGLGEHPGLVAGEVDDAVGDDHVDASRREAGSPRSRRAGTRRSRRPPCAGSRGPAPASRRSCRGRRPCRSGPTRLAESRTSMPPPGAEVEHGLAGVELGDRGRVAAAQRGHRRGVRQLAPGPSS